MIYKLFCTITMKSYSIEANSEYEAKMLELLGELLHDKNDDISYFLYDLDAVNEKDLIVPQDKCELYNSPDTLYDYLIKNIDNKYE